jgi:hypothetical protein
VLDELQLTYTSYNGQNLNSPAVSIIRGSTVYDTGNFWFLVLLLYCDELHTCPGSLKSWVITGLKICLVNFFCNIMQFLLIFLFFFFIKIEKNTETFRFVLAVQHRFLLSGDYQLSERCVMCNKRNQKQKERFWKWYMFIRVYQRSRWTSVRINSPIILVFRDVTLCSGVDRCRRFEQNPPPSLTSHKSRALDVGIRCVSTRSRRVDVAR